VLQTGIVPDTTWTHIAGTYEVGGMMTIYINGQMAGEIVASPNNHSFNTNPFRIGIAPWDINALGFFGYIDEVRYWNIVLEESTIRDWMHKDMDIAHPNNGSLTLYHKYDEGTGDTTADASGLSNDGTLIGALWLPSTVPFKGTFDLFENEVRGVWAGQTQANSAILTFSGSDFTGEQSAVFANSDGGYDLIAQPSTTYNYSLDKVWRVTTQGDIPPNLEVSFDLSPFSFVQFEEVFLLLNGQPDFSDATTISGTVNGSTFTVPADFFILDGMYYTLGFKQEGLSADEIKNSELDIDITPNPNNGHFQLSIENPLADKLHFKLTDPTGKLLFEKSIFTGQQAFNDSFDFSHLSKGIYFVQLSDEKSVSLGKMIIE